MLSESFSQPSRLIVPKSLSVFNSNNKEDVTTAFFPMLNVLFVL